MSDGEVDFQSPCGAGGPELAVREGETIFREGEQATSSLSSCGDRSRSRAAIAGSKLSARRADLRRMFS